MLIYFGEHAILIDRTCVNNYVNHNFELFNLLPANDCLTENIMCGSKIMLEKHVHFMCHSFNS